MKFNLLRSLSNGTDQRAPIPAHLPASGRVATSAKTGYLSQIEIFSDLSKDEMDWVAAITTMTTCDRGRLFYIPDETGEVLFLLKHGRVHLYRMSPEGKKIVLATLNEGAIFGEMSIIGQGMYDTFAEAAEECVLCVMSRADLERLVMEKPLVALRLVESLGRRVRELESQVEDIAFKSVRARLAARLLRLRDEAGSDEITRYTHQDLADMVGTYRETATQVLNELRAEEIINIGRKKITILDMERLKQIAEK